MALDKIVGGVVIVAAIGIGAAILAPGLVRAGRPLLRKALAQGMALAREGQSAFEAAWEDFEDVLAEAAADASQQKQAPAGATVTPFSRPSAPDASAAQGQSADAV
jgi:hypothetical protein